MKASDSADNFNKLADITTVFGNSAIGVRNCVLFTIFFGIYLGVWFNFFEGRGEK